MARELADILASGEILLVNTEHCNIDGTLRLGQASEADDDGSLLQITDNGVVGLHPPIATSEIFGTISTTDHTSVTAETDIVTLDFASPGYGSSPLTAIAAGEGAIAIIYRVDNALNNQNTEVTTYLYKDTGGGFVLQGSDTRTIGANLTQDVSYSVINGASLGTTDLLKFAVSADRAIDIKGSLLPSTLQVTDSKKT